jgi:hypothetical protein
MRYRYWIDRYSICRHQRDGQITIGRDAAGDSQGFDRSRGIDTDGGVVENQTAIFELMDGSVAPVSKVQVKVEPEPKVVLTIE